MQKDVFHQIRPLYHLLNQVQHILPHRFYGHWAHRAFLNASCLFLASTSISELIDLLHAIDINPEYINIARQRLAEIEPLNKTTNKQVKAVNQIMEETLLRTRQVAWT